MRKNKRQKLLIWNGHTVKHTYTYTDTCTIQVRWRLKQGLLDTPDTREYLEKSRENIQELVDHFEWRHLLEILLGNYTLTREVNLVSSLCMQGPLLLTRINLNPKMDKLYCWLLGMDNWFHPTLYNRCAYLSMLGLNLNYVRKRGH